MIVFWGVKKKNPNRILTTRRFLCDDTKDEGSCDGRGPLGDRGPEKAPDRSPRSDLGEARRTGSVGCSPQVVVGQDSSTHTNSSWKRVYREPGPLALYGETVKGKSRNAVGFVIR